MTDLDWRARLTEPTLTEALLRDACVAALRQAGHFAAVEPLAESPLGLRLVQGDAAAATLQLDKLFAQVTATAPQGRAALVEALVAALKPRATPPAREQLIPLVKNADWATHAPVPDLALTPLAADLVVLYAFDGDETIAYARWPEVDAFGLSRDELWQLALANLRARLPPDLGIRGDGKSFMLLAGGTHEASLLLLDEIWDHLATQVPGDVVACALARDICLVTSTEREGGLESMAAAAARVFEAAPAHLVSSTLLRRQGRRWVPLAQAAPDAPPD